MKHASNNIHFGFDENEYLHHVTLNYSTKENNENNGTGQNPDMTLEIGLDKLKALHEFFTENHPEINIGENIVDFINYLASLDYDELKDLTENTESENESE